MSYLIILFVVALALAPVLALMPSKQQKHLIALRDSARAAGLQVQVCKLPQTHRQKVRKEDEESGVAYRLLWRHPDARFKTIHFTVLRAEVSAHESEGHIESILRTALDSLPDCIMGLEFTNIGLAAFWQEQGDTDSVEIIAQTLMALKEQLQDMSW